MYNLVWQSVICRPGKLLIPSTEEKNQMLHLARLSQLAAEIGVSTAKNAKNASPIKATARKSRRSEDQVAFHVA
jgi:hypothetical protein